MELGFWQQRWDAREIGFHEGAPNTLLVRHAHLLRPASRVLVPLCGKAVDLIYLASLGHTVDGVEAVRAPCVELFEERGLARVEEQRPPFVKHHAGPVTVWQGDMFDATRARLGGFTGAYDRAALVALAPMTRVKYVDTLAQLLDKNARMLLITLTYDQSKRPGPPWSIEPAVVRSLFRRHFVIEPLESHDSSANPGMRAAGITHVTESAWLLTRL